MTSPNHPQGRHAATVRLPSGAHATDGDAGAPRDGPPANGPARWEIRHEIARGGMGIVYLAFDPTLNRFVAIKRLAVCGELRQTMQARFLREARAMAALNHIHICRIYAVSEDADGPYIAMEYIAGPEPADVPGDPAPPFSLETLVFRHGAMSQAQTLALIEKIGGAVAHAHQRGVIHRDLKPANVLLDEHGEPRVVDFGLAALAIDADERLTLTGDKLLSLGYGAPEQENDATQTDHRADIYALGGVIYFCLTGENPRFYRDHRVPETWRVPLLRALEKDREKRWSSINDLLEALREALASEAQPVPGRDGWICKWCHNLNPMAERHCEECGWDGLVLCPNCEAALRFGMRVCPGCNANQRAFEDANGLLDLLREFRRQKQYERLLERARFVDSLRAKGAVSEATYQQIEELRQGAAWAVQRKDELRRAIAAATAAEDYERVRELLNEYDIIDTSDTYGDLRARLPEKLAERHIAKLYQRLQTARAFMDQKKLASCRAIMTALRDLQQSIVSLANTVPTLRRVSDSGMPVPDPDGAAPDNPAELFAYCGAAIDRLEQDLSDEESRIQHWQTEAETAFHNQDYHHCIRLCREVALITAEPTPAGNLLEQAKEAYQTIDRLSKQAEKALAAKQWQRAGELADHLLTEWKADHEGARRIVNSLTRRRRRHVAQQIALLAFALFTLYVLVMPPVLRLRNFEAMPAPGEAPVFGPILPVYRLTPLRQYADFWGLRP